MPKLSSKKKFIIKYACFATLSSKIPLLRRFISKSDIKPSLGTEEMESFQKEESLEINKKAIDPIKRLEKKNSLLINSKLKGPICFLAI
jgi:hypothetical protein